MYCFQLDCIPSLGTKLHSNHNSENITAHLFSSPSTPFQNPICLSLPAVALTSTVSFLTKQEGLDLCCLSRPILSFLSIFSLISHYSFKAPALHFFPPSLCCCCCGCNCRLAEQRAPVWHSARADSWQRGK